MGKILYWCSSFSLPQRIIIRIEQLLARFLWSGRGQKCNHRIAWLSVCKPQEKGGLGLRNIRKLNQACLMRYVWAVASKKDSLWVRWMHSNFLRSHSIWTRRTPSVISWMTRSIFNIRHLAQPHVTHRIGNGRSTMLWHEPWHPDGILMHIVERYPYSAPISAGDKVALIRLSTGWDITGYHHSCLFEAWQKLSHIHTLDYHSDDNILWSASPSGKFTLKSAYDRLTSAEPSVDWHELVWFKNHIPRYSFISWLAFWNRLPTFDRMQAWGRQGPNMCYLCLNACENLDHIFFECDYTYKVWEEVLKRCHLRPRRRNWSENRMWFFHHFKGSSESTTQRKLTLTTSIYHIWTERNRRMHDERKRSWELLAGTITHDIQSMRGCVPPMLAG